MVVIKVKDGDDEYFPSCIENNNISLNDTVKLCGTVTENVFVNTDKKHLEFVESEESDIKIYSKKKENKFYKTKKSNFLQTTNYKTKPLWVKKRIINFIKILKDPS